jgi:activating signal cointegrator complex subunit 1
MLIFPRATVTATARSITNQTTALTTISIGSPRQLNDYQHPSRISSRDLPSPQLHSSTRFSQARRHISSLVMGKKQNGEYNDFLDGERLHDHNEIRTSLQGPSSTTIDSSSPSTGQHPRGSKKHGKGKGGPKKPPLTHFLCLPLVTEASRPRLHTGLEKLKHDLEKDNIIPTKAIRPPGTLHLTLGVMSLDPTQLEEAKHFLQNLNLHILLRDLTQRKIAEQAAEDGTISENLNAAALPDTDALTINLEALTPMQSPSRTSILYANPKDPTHRLLSFAAAVKKEFTEKGFMLPEERELKLHATIINTIYAKSGGHRGRKSSVKETLKHIEHKVSPHHHADNDGDGGVGHTQTERSEGHGPEASTWMRFDARDLIERYKDFTWAEDVRIDRVQMCKMGAKKVWSGGVEGEGEVVDEKYEVVCERGIFE